MVVWAAVALVALAGCRSPAPPPAPDPLGHLLVSEPPEGLQQVDSLSGPLAEADLTGPDAPFSEQTAKLFQKHGFSAGATRAWSSATRIAQVTVYEFDDARSAAAFLHELGSLYDQLIAQTPGSARTAVSGIGDAVAFNGLSSLKEDGMKEPFTGGTTIFFTRAARVFQITAATQDRRQAPAVADALARAQAQRVSSPQPSVSPR